MNNKRKITLKIIFRFLILIQQKMILIIFYNLLILWILDQV